MQKVTISGNNAGIGQGPWALGKGLGMHIVIVESDTPDLARRARETRGADNVQRFAAVIGSVLPQAGIRAVAPYDGEDVQFDGADAAIFTGSAVDWQADDPRARPLADALEAAFAAGLPVWGSCNGMNLGAILLGGSVGGSPSGVEVGLARDMRLTAEGRHHPMMAGRRDGFCVPCIHRDEVRQLPEGAVVLAGNAHSPVQAFAYERDGVSFWGVQYHPEYPAQAVGAALAARDPSDPRAADLLRADTDPEAARRLGADPADLVADARSRELRNWLAHVTPA